MSESNTPETDSIKRVKKFGLLGDIQADLFAMRNHARSMEVQRDAAKRQRDDLISLFESVLGCVMRYESPATKGATQDRLREIKEGGQ